MTKSIVISGPPAVGKTTVAKGLAEEFQLQYLSGGDVLKEMAKEQGLSLNPMRISGVCGRLLCCLGYEGEQYRVMKAKLPKEGQRVSVPMGIATVVDGNPLKEMVMVELESGVRVELPLSEVTIIDR